MDVSTISLCMIVRDEEANLARCLESACGFVNEIIVVDTGSRDATPTIAKRYGARICHLPWQEDFSQARNESLKQAIGEWVLVLDADEELPPGAVFLPKPYRLEDIVAALTAPARPRVCAA